jgi:Mg-chelatase subunit ChlD
MYFGTRDGFFRIFPGRRRRTCYDYDPRERPWYIAASSGPKNIILVLDTSGSMAGQRLALLKEAAKRVVETLRVGDRVAVIKFDSNATSFTDNGGMFVANETNKDLLIDTIENVTVGDGGTNYTAAFNTAFEVMNRTIEEEDLKCNSAILFLTDGEVRESESSDQSSQDQLEKNRRFH